MRALLAVASLVPSGLWGQGQFGTNNATPCEPFRANPAAEVFEGVEYRAGHAGFTDRLTGTLYLTRDSIVLAQECASAPTLRLSLAIITGADVQGSTRDPSLGDKLLMGAFAREKHEEFIQISTQTPATVEVIVLKVPPDVGPGLVHKIRFYAKLPAK